MVESQHSLPDSEFVSSVDERRRSLLRAVLGGAAAYSVPLIVSFGMAGLRPGTAVAGGFGPNQLNPGDIASACAHDPDCAGPPGQAIQGKLGGPPGQTKKSDDIP